MVVTVYTLCEVEALWVAGSTGSEATVPLIRVILEPPESIVVSQQAQTSESTGNNWKFTKRNNGHSTARGGDGLLIDRTFTEAHGGTWLCQGVPRTSA
jgi:hypothetical protein